MKNFLTAAFLCVSTLLWSQSTPSDDHVFRLTETSVGVINETPSTVVFSMDVLSLDAVGGWSAAICSPEEVSVLTVSPGAFTATANAGGPAEFLVETIADGGFWVAAVVNLMIDEVVPTGNDYELHVATYSSATEGAFPLTFCTLELTDTVVVPVEGELNGFSLLPILEETDASFLGIAPALFNRGDCNQDLDFNMVDVIQMLQYLYVEAPRPNEDCLALCDFNADGNLFITDAILMLDGMFGGDFPPPGEPIDCNDAPTVTCGGTGGLCP